MNKKYDDDAVKYQLRANILKAMAHPTRLFIMDELSQNDSRCVNELQEMIGGDLSTISKHLSILKKAGILIDRKSGTQVFYSIKVPCIMDFMKCVEILIRENAIEKLKNL